MASWATLTGAAAGPTPFSTPQKTRSAIPRCRPPMPPTPLLSSSAASRPSARSSAVRSSVVLATSVLVILAPLAVATEQVMRLHPLLGDDRRAQRQLAAQHGGRDDLRELVHLAGAVAAEQLEALLLRGQPRPAA